MYIISFIVCTIVGLIVAEMYYHSKNHAIDMICKHPELSDEKVKAIIKMMSMQFRKRK